MALKHNPTSLIIDTDIGNDIDDPLALAIAYTLERQGMCKIQAITISKDNPWSPVYMDLLNNFYGRGDIPVGMVKNGVTEYDGKYAPDVANLKRENGNHLFARKLSLSNQPEEAVKVLRKTLARQSDNSVVVIMLGFSTNMARLLKTGPDDYSSLDGRRLFEKKVRFVSAMCADFSDKVQKNPTMDNREFNIWRDIPSAQYFFSNCPVPVVLTGYELGCALPYPSESIEKDFTWAPEHPIVEAYKRFRKMPYDRPSWDLIAVYYAICGAVGFFNESMPGELSIDDNGFALFNQNPDGRHRYLTLNSTEKSAVISTFRKLCSSPYGTGAKSLERIRGVKPKEKITSKDEVSALQPDR